MPMNLRDKLRFRFTTEQSPEEKRVTKVVLLTTIICFLLYIFLGYPNFYQMVFGTPHFVLANLTYGSDIYWYTKIYYNWGMACVLFLVVPFFVARKLKIPRQDLGVQSGDNKFGVIILLLGVIIVIGGPFIIADSVYQATYPLLRPEAVPALNVPVMVLGEASYVIIYYIPYEFFWRGFAQFPLRKYGKINTIWIILWTTVLTTLVHLPVPPGELAAAVVFGVVLGWATLRANSMIYGLIPHAAVGVGSDIVAALAMNGLI